MVKKAKKIRTQASTDEEISDECKKETKCGDCDITWTTPPKQTEIKPPENTVAVVVDVVDNRGAIRIFEKGGDKFVDGVGTEEKGNIVIVPWNSNWWFRASGSLQVGYVVKRSQ